MRTDNLMRTCSNPLSDPIVIARIEAAGTTAKIAAILRECGYEPAGARFVASIMSGESSGDVIDPPAKNP